jgi:hypothetical protein
MPPNWPPMHKLDSLIFCRTFVVFLLCFMSDLGFFRFFNRLKDGHLFDSQTVGYLESAGKWWLGIWLLTVIPNIIFRQIYPDHAISIDGICDFSDLFGGLFVIFTAWLFREAQELQEEQELTV